jgi:hypothetical protein
MRWVFIALVAINGVMAYWLAQNEGPSALQKARVPAEAINAEPLILLSEAQVGAVTSARASLGEARKRLQYAEVVGGAQGGAICTLVGPFAEIAAGDQFVQRLSALEIRAELQELELPGEMAFWVYLMPELSRKAALRRLHELQAKGVDSFVIPKGELANGISFGMFNERLKAETTLSGLKSLGYQVQIKELERSYQESWVVLIAQEAQKVSSELWFQLLEGLPDLQQRQNFCPGVASS